MKTSRIDRSCIRVIVILCRSHANASPASFMCQGFLEFLLSSHNIAKVLRENFVFKIVPMVNPDGVFLGNNRCNLIGQDMNRVWQVATEFSHPEIFAVKNMLKEIDNSDVSMGRRKRNSKISLLFDFLLILRAVLQSVSSIPSIAYILQNLANFGW